MLVCGMRGLDGAVLSMAVDDEFYYILKYAYVIRPTVSDGKKENHSITRRLAHGDEQCGL